MRFHPQHVRVVPLSGLTGQNITALEEDCALKSWYSGPTLLEAIDTFLVPPRGVDRPLRAVVHEVVAADLSRGRYELEVSVLQGKLSSERTLGFHDLSSLHVIKPSACGAGGDARATGAVASAAAAASGAATTSSSGDTVKYHVGTALVTSSTAAPATASEGYKVVSVLNAGQRGTISISNK